MNSRRFIVTIATLLVYCACSRDNALSAFDESTEPSIVLLAVTKPRDAATAKTIDQTKNATDTKLDDLLGTKSEDIFNIQMQIADNVGSVSPVLLLAKDATTRERIHKACQEHGELCQKLRTGRVRIAQVAYDGPWIRDYGPQFGTIGREPVVLDARYHDVRSDYEQEDLRIAIDKERQSLLLHHMLEHALSDLNKESKQGGPIAPASSADANAPSTHVDKKSSEKLLILSQWSEVLKNSSLTARTRDDHSPFSIAEAALRDPGFRLINTPVDLDGGNLFHLTDGRCVTTGSLIGRNSNNEKPVRTVLAEYYGCEETIFLRALPGSSVIEHVDMFLLPVGKRKRVLIASYGPEQAVLRGHLAELTDTMQALVLEAALAMDENARRLETLGYEVIRVPSPLPRKVATLSASAEHYYPTVLNALALTTQSGLQYVFMPYYKEYETDVQDVAARIISDAMDGARVIPIEATAAAKAQGAIHCLTLAVPQRLSRTGDDQDSHRKDVQNRVETIRKQSLLGTWRTDDLWREPQDWDTLVISEQQVSVHRNGIVISTWPLDAFIVADSDSSLGLRGVDQTAGLLIHRPDEKTVRVRVPGHDAKRALPVRLRREPSQ